MLVPFIWSELLPPLLKYANPDRPKVRVIAELGSAGSRRGRKTESAVSPTTYVELSQAGVGTLVNVAAPCQTISGLFAASCADAAPSEVVMATAVAKQNFRMVSPHREANDQV